MKSWNCADCPIVDNIDFDICEYCKRNIDAKNNLWWTKIKTDTVNPPTWTFTGTINCDPKTNFTVWNNALTYTAKGNY